MPSELNDLGGWIAHKNELKFPVPVSVSVPVRIRKEMHKNLHTQPHAFSNSYIYGSYAVARCPGGPACGPTFVGSNPLHTTSKTPEWYPRNTVSQGVRKHGA